MPLQPSVTEIWLNNIIACLEPAVGMLNMLKDSFGTPFIPAISSTTLALITEVQNARRNKVECIQLLESVHGLLYAIVNVHIQSGTTGILPPMMLKHIGRFTKTIHKIHTFVEAQRDGSKIKNFFRQSEMTALLKDCQRGVQQAQEVFKIETAIGNLNSVREMEKKTQEIQNELLELIANFSDWETSDGASSMYDMFNNSSRSFSMLPAKPKIFYGRERELETILQNLAQDSPRVAILGAGGMGKTSLARAALHHPDIATKYAQRFFVPCDSATTRIDVAALVGLHLGLEPGKDLTKSVVQHFSKGPLCLLILDNLETAWEPIESRGGVEDFLSLLTDVPHLALLVTMRGAERPTKVRWTHPFLAPLIPLSDAAAHQVFVCITEDVHDIKDVKQLLRLTDNMPLAIDLIAHLVDDESCASILDRWKTEKTALLSAGHDKRSNLNASIIISLSSPRIQSMAGAKELLSLLSILPDGLSDVELVQSNLPILNIPACKTALLRTSLAYLDDQKRLKSLVPIREHVQHFHPPSFGLIQPLRKHFHLLLELYRDYNSEKMEPVVKEIRSNHGNLQQLLMLGLNRDNPDLADTINCIISLSSFSRLAGHGYLLLMDGIPAVLPQPTNHRLEIIFITEVPIDDPFLEFGIYYYWNRKNPSTALHFLHKALALAQSAENFVQQSNILNHVAVITHKTGDYVAAQRNASEAGRLAGLCADLYQESRALRTETTCRASRGDYKTSIPLLSRAQSLLELCGMSEGNLNLQLNMHRAQLHLLKSEYAEALEIHNRIIQTISAEARPVTHGFSLVNIAEIGILMGADEHDVRETLDKAKAIFHTFHYQGDLEFWNIPAAKIVLEKSIRSSWGKDNEATSYCLERLSNVTTWAVIYMSYAQRSQQKLPLHKALQFLGDFFLSKVDLETAENLLLVALEGFIHMDIHRSKAECMMKLGDLAKHRGDLSNAKDLHETAGILFERTGRKGGNQVAVCRAS
ncbi:hypothetical protein DFH09DRAFT_1227335 [Mycena vulgaris]|nr:hypothetical protein DFH09DRAFT_1227335 [Mycena vulgaris]